MADQFPWKKLWATGQALWHKEEVNPLLCKYLNILTQGKSNRKIYVPMCGKSVDMKWLSDQGHTVVGVEFDDFACRSFFEDQHLEYDVMPCLQTDGKLYKSRKGEIRLYCCDVFKFNKYVESDFDAIWDRGALEALPADQRPRYMHLLKELMRPTCHFFLNTHIYDESLFSDPPFIISLEELKQNFGEGFSIVQLGDLDCSEIAPDAFKSIGAEFREVLRHIYKE